MIQIKVKGMHCRSCEMLINESLEDAGVDNTVSFKEGIVEIKSDSKKIGMDSIKDIIRKEGYEVE